MIDTFYFGSTFPLAVVVQVPYAQIFSWVGQYPDDMAHNYARERE